MTEVLIPKKTTSDSSTVGNMVTARAKRSECASSAWLKVFHEVLTQECIALEQVAKKIAAKPDTIAQACAILQGGDPKPVVNRRVVVSGIGKAGLIARKVSATMSSIGTAATFLHPVEALHGDLGFVQSSDAAMLFSYSGETVELNRLAAELKRLRCPIVAVTRCQSSTLGKAADACIELGDVREACYLGLAPTSSTTAMLAIGDALALAVASARGFQIQDFAANHPAGSLGLRFRSVQELMRTGDRQVCVLADAALRDVIRAVSAAKTGAAVLIRPDRSLLGIFTDGDLRRALLEGGDVLDREVMAFASMPCYSIAQTESVAEALKIFHNTRIEEMPVVESSTNQVVGLLCRKDIAVY